MKLNTASLPHEGVKIMNIIFDKSAAKNPAVEKTVKEFLEKVETLEKIEGLPVTIFQDGVKKSYYIRCAVSGSNARRNCSAQSKAKRALLMASSRARAPVRRRAKSAACAAIL